MYEQFDMNHEFLLDQLMPNIMKTNKVAHIKNLHPKVPGSKQRIITREN